MRDAVGNDILGMEQALRDRGHEVRIFAEGWNTDRRVYHVRKLPAFLKKPDDVLIYHYSIGWERALQLFRELPCRKVLRYHNVTPPEFFEPYHAGIANSCRLARRLLPDFIAAGCDLYLSNSEFSRQDLIGHGADGARAFVVPPFHQVDFLYDLEPDLTTLGEYSMSFPRTLTNILMVGRMVPNKGYDALIRAFGLYHTHYNPASRLILTGKLDPQLETYYAELRANIAEHGLAEAVVFTGVVPDAVLKALYLSAHLFVTMSEHEGFCVPLVEAMALKIPIVALGSSVIPETLGDGGLIWDEADPHVLAASLQKILTDSNLAESLGEAGFARYRNRFTLAKIKASFDEALNVFAAGAGREP